MASVTSACCARNWVELLCLGFGALRLAPEHQPGGPARRQGLARRLGHSGQGLARAAVPGGQALGLPQPAGIGRDHAIAPSIAPLAEVAKQPHGGIAPGIPALEQIRLIGGEHTVPEVTATFAPRKGGGPEIALHRAQTQPDLLRNGRGRPALAVQGPDLLYAAPAGVPGAAPRAAAPAGGCRGVARARPAPHRAAARAAGTSVALTASRAWLCVRNTWSRASRRFCSR